MAALWNNDWKIHKHGKVFTDLVSKTWWTNFDGKTAANEFAYCVVSPATTRLM
jgi:hypothetical protein